MFNEFIEEIKTHNLKDHKLELPSFHGLYWAVYVVQETNDIYRYTITLEANDAYLQVDSYYKSLDTFFILELFYKLLQEVENYLQFDLYPDTKDILSRVREMILESVTKE